MSLRDYLGVLRRHKWIILTCVVLFPLAAVALSLRQQRLYEGTAEVLISHQNLAASLGGLQQDFTEADRLAQTQASLARVPEVAKRALAAAGVTSLTADELLNDSKVSTQPNADLLDFSVTNRSRTLAERLATAYAQSFSTYQREVDSAAVRSETASSDSCSALASASVLHSYGTLSTRVSARPRRSQSGCNCRCSHASPRLRNG